MDAFDRGVAVEVGGESYTLVLTTRAAKDITAKYGGLDKIGKTLTGSITSSATLEVVAYALVALAASGTAIYNMEHPDDKKTPLTAEMVDLTTTPADLAAIQPAVIEAILNGMKRNIESEEDEKNARAGK